MDLRPWQHQELGGIQIDDALPVFGRCLGHLFPVAEDRGQIISAESSDIRLLLVAGD